MKNAGSVLEKTAQAFLQGFSSEELQRLVFYALNEQLDVIAGGANLAERVDNLLIWAVRHDKLPMLVAAAIAARPEKSEFRDMVATVHANNATVERVENEASMLDERTGERIDRMISEFGQLRGDMGQLRGEIGILNARLANVERDFASREKNPMNWNIIAVAIVLAILLSVSSYWISVQR